MHVVVRVRVSIWLSRSDRHIIYMNEEAPVLDPDKMVQFDEGDRFQADTHWDHRYNTSLNVRFTFFVWILRGILAKGPIAQSPLLPYQLTRPWQCAQHATSERSLHARCARA